MPDDPFPDVLDLRQVAAKLGKSRSWLIAHLKAHPCGRMIGAKRVFTPGDYAALLNTFPKDRGPTVPISRPSVSRRTRHSARSEAEAHAELERLLAPAPRRRGPRKP